MHVMTTLRLRYYDPVMPLYSAYCINFTMKPTGVDIEVGCRGQIVACPAGNYKDRGARSMAYVRTYYLILISAAL